MSCIKYMIRSARYSKIYLFVFGLLSILSTVIDFILPYINGLYIDKLLNEKDISTLKEVLLIICVISGSLFLIGYILNILRLKITSDISFRILNEEIKHLQRVEFLKLINIDSAYLSQRINEDSNQLVTFFVDNIVRVFSDFAMLIGGLYLIARLNFKFFFVIFILILFQIITYISSKNIIYKKSTQIKENQNRYFETINEQLLYLKEIKVDATYLQENERLESIYKHLYKNYLKLNYITNAISTMSDSLVLLFNVILLILGTREYFYRRISIGEMMMFFSYFNIIIGIIKYYLGIGTEFQTVKVAYNRLCELDSIEEEIQGNIELKTIEEIKVQNLNYSYMEEKSLIDGLNTKFKKGKIYLIRGGNGRGKSTFIDILIGILNTNITGDIVYNNIKIQDINLNILRKNNISVLLQELKIKNIRVRELLNENFNFESNTELIKKIQKKKLEAMYLSKDFYIEDFLNKNMYELSGGELRKIYILKTLLKDVDMYIFDEPTIGLDINSIEKFKNILLNLKKDDKLICLVTHDKDLMDIEVENVYI